MTATQQRTSWVRIGSLNSLQAARHHLTLRHKHSGEYHSLLLFSFPTRSSDGASEDEQGPRRRTLYCMEATCPHLGAPLENASLEDQADEEDEIEDMVIVCPWHEYDFSLRTGESSTGVQACVYAVEQRPSPSSSSDLDVWVQTPSPSAPAAATVGLGATGAEEGKGEEEEEWDVVEVRAVSEAFTNQERERAMRIAHGDALESGRSAAATISVEVDVEGAAAAVGKLALGSSAQSPAEEGEAAADPSVPVPPPEPLPRTLVEWACLVLNTPEPRAKVAYTRMAARAFRSGGIKAIGGGYAKRSAQPATPEAGSATGTSAPSANERTASPSYEWARTSRETPPLIPPRLASATIVAPNQTAKRGKGGTEKSRIALLHSLANIEQWAIDLAWDIIARGGELAHADLSGPGSAGGGSGEQRKLPTQFYSDFLKVAEDEAKHFSLLVERLEALGSYFGSHPVHHGLWDSALETMHSLPARLSIIHLVHEARGLDVNPTTIMKFRNAKDAESVDILTTIHLDEITHVSAGHRWLSYLCAHSVPPRDPVQVFRREVQRNFVGKLKGPFNSADRAKAGLSKDWYEELAGEKGSSKYGGRTAAPIGVQRAEVAGG